MLPGQSGKVTYTVNCILTALHMLLVAPGPGDLGSVAAGLQIAPITCCRTAVGANSAAEVQLTFYPSASGWSTMYPDEQEVLSAMDVFLEKSLSNLAGIEATPWARVGQLLQKSAPEWLSKRLQRCVGMWARLVRT